LSSGEPEVGVTDRSELEAIGSASPFSLAAEA
jgi:hypothetical protein